MPKSPLVRETVHVVLASLQSPDEEKPELAVKPVALPPPPPPVQPKHFGPLCTRTLACATFDPFWSISGASTPPSPRASSSDADNSNRFRMLTRPRSKKRRPRAANQPRRCSLHRL